MTDIGDSLGVGPRADVPLRELDPNLRVWIEKLDRQYDHALIHDPDHAPTPDEHEEMALADALDLTTDFCSDCFTRAMIGAGVSDG